MTYSDMRLNAIVRALDPFHRETLTRSASEAPIIDSAQDFDCVTRSMMENDRSAAAADLVDAYWLNLSGPKRDQLRAHLRQVMLEPSEEVQSVSLYERRNVVFRGQFADEVVVPHFPHGWRLAMRLVMPSLREVHFQAFVRKLLGDDVWTVAGHTFFPDDDSLLQSLTGK